MPSPHYGGFMRKLAGTVRDDIAQCAAAAYKDLTVPAACKLLLLPTPAALAAYIVEKGLPWVVAADKVRFSAADKPRAEVDAVTLMRNTLAYATELERIV